MTKKAPFFDDDKFMKRSRAERKAYAEAMLQMDRNKLAIEDEIRKIEQVPEAWHVLHTTHPTAPKKESLTLRLDADMIKWYRALGRGYQARMNGVLRSYMLCLMSRIVVDVRNTDWKGDTI